MSPRSAHLVARVITDAETRLPRALGPFRREVRSSLAKLWSGNPDLHFEIWQRARLGIVEVGLHFESDALTNLRLLAAFRAREKEIRAALGDAPRLEEWDRGWTRIYEPLAVDADDLADRCAERLSAYVRALEPILREEVPRDVSWRPPRAPSGGRSR